MKRKLISVFLTLIMVIGLMASLAVTSGAAAASNFAYYYVKVTSSSALNIREQPSTNASVAGSIPSGTVVKVYNEYAGWGCVVYGTCGGWISLRYTSKTPIKLNVPIFKQEKSNTCGSACGAMVLRYNGKSTTESKFFARANRNGEGTYVYMVTNTLNYFLGTTKYKYTQCGSYSLTQYYNTILGSLDKKCPVILPLRFSSTSAFKYSTKGHYVVIKKLYISNNEYYCTVNDPKYGKEVTLSLRNLFSYNKAHSGFIIGAK